VLPLRAAACCCVLLRAAACCCVLLRAAACCCRSIAPVSGQASAAAAVADSPSSIPQLKLCRTQSGMGRHEVALDNCDAAISQRSTPVHQDYIRTRPCVWIPEVIPP